MLKKFTHGLVFGAGFGIAFMGIWVVGVIYVLPKVFDMGITESQLRASATLESDNIYRRNIVGSWVDSPNDKSFGSRGHITNYSDNGTVYFRGYLDGECTVQSSEVIGNWVITNNYLIISVTHSNTNLLPVGLVVVDVIVDIGADEKILVSADTGNVQYRSRSDKCLYQDLSGGI